MKSTATTKARASYPQGKLTEDQRRLLYGVGGWLVLKALASPSGLAHLFSGHTGGTCLGNGMATGAWEREWWLAERGKVVLGRPWDKPIVTVTKAQFVAFAKTIPAELHTRIVEDSRNGSNRSRTLLAQALGIELPGQPRQYADYEQMNLW